MNNNFKPLSIFDDDERFIIPKREPVAEKNPESPAKDKVTENINYLILDAASWDSEINPAFSYGNEYSCLFATKGGEYELSDVVPYLFEYTVGDELSNWVKYKERKGKRVLYLTSSHSMEQLRKHLRRFLRVKTEECKWRLFRFYDPFVLMDAFPHLTEQQKKDFLSKIEKIEWICPVTKEIREITNLFSNEKEDINAYIGDAWTFSREQTVEIGISAFVRRAAIRIIDNKNLDMKVENLLQFVREKVEQAKEYDINNEGPLFDYILLFLKHRLTRYRVLPQDIDRILTEPSEYQFQKIDKLQKLLTKKYTV